MVVSGAGARIGPIQNRMQFEKVKGFLEAARAEGTIAAGGKAMERAGSAEPLAVARALEGARLEAKPFQGVHQGLMRAADHQFIQPLYVSIMQRAGSAGVRFDNEGSGYGFRTVRFLPPAATQPPARCQMRRP